jgi:hypothetical protein
MLAMLTATPPPSAASATAPSAAAAIFGAALVIAFASLVGVAGGLVAAFAIVGR